MAQTTRNLNLSKAAYICQENPGTHYTVVAGQEYRVGAYLRGTATYYYNKFLMAFDAFPTSLRHNKLYSIKACIPARIGYGTLKIYPLYSTFNADSVTYQSAPTETSSADGYLDNVGLSFGVWYDFLAPDSSLSRLALKNGFSLWTISQDSDSSKVWHVKSVLSNGNAPYLQVTYDDSVMVTSQVTITSGPSDTVSASAAQRFSWEYEGANGTCADPTWKQASATLYWRASGASTWNAVNVSGASLSVTVPANTFPPGSTIQYYIRGTDTEGTTSSTTTYSFSTAAPTLTPTAYPNGSGIYTGMSLNFRWSVSDESGELTQQSAILYWKGSTEGSYHQFSIAGNNKVANVPANTFPSGATVQWHVTATLAGGVTASSADKSFTTIASSIQAENYPSGNNVNYGDGISFTWKFVTSAGELAQQSATLYWRASTEDPWTGISASGSTKSLTVPAYTFGANKTIYWYLSGTDAGGTSSTTNQKNFKTSAPKIAPQSTPTSGYMDPRNAITFSWYFSDGENAYEQSSASLMWRTAGETNWTSIAASGSTQNLTVPANTFPTLSTIEWKLTGTVRGNYSSETEVYSFSTTASTAYARTRAPVGRAEDGSRPITFSWIVENSDGSEPSRVTVKWKLPTETAASWRTILDENDAVYTVTVPAYTFSAGPVEWQVIAYNRDSVAGPASVATFACMVAPDAPEGLSATAVPRTTIRWQASGQEAYEIEIDGQRAAKAYAPGVYSWKQTEPLSDGIHSIRVRVQGAYGMWSEWSETTVSVENVPDGTLTLTGKMRVDAALRWTYTGAGDPETIAIYRDGIWIGTATGKTEFLDRFVLGRHEWRVEYWYASGYYTRSASVSGTLCADTVLIAEFSGGDWQKLDLSENSTRSIQISWVQQSEAYQILGSPWPMVETSPYETLTGKFDCAFLCKKRRNEFEALRGKTVIMKTPDGSVLIGALLSLSRVTNEFYVSYSFSVQQMTWEDFVNDDADS